MTIEINIPPVLQALAGDARKIGVAGSTVGECLKALVKKYPDVKSRLFNKRGRLNNGINIFVNGENAYPEPLAKAVREGDKIHIAFIVLGG
jgi:molybdopterin converting factor small subunit